jgi:large subunit ribosomal protein L15
MDMELHRLSPGKGARKSRKRVGRGNACGWGRTAGRGEKGQKARTGGKVRVGFEGGQMPLYCRIPKFGFRSKSKLSGLNCFEIVNLDVLEKRFKEGDTINLETLKSISCRPGAKQKAGVKILGAGKLTKKINVVADSVSKTAKSAIEDLGGSVEILQKNKEEQTEKQE